MAMHSTVEIILWADYMALRSCLGNQDYDGCIVPLWTRAFFPNIFLSCFSPLLSGVVLFALSSSAGISRLAFLRDVVIILWRMLEGWGICTLGFYLLAMELQC